MSASSHPSLRHPKGRPARLNKQEKAADLTAIDRRERAKCKKRSGGRCEVFTLMDAENSALRMRCIRRDSQNHHLLGGTGRRNKGRSVLAEHRIQVCDSCHRDITHHVLQPVGTTEQRECAATVRYVRVK